MVSALDSESRGPSSSPARVVCVVVSVHFTLQCLSPRRSINGYQQTVGETRRNAEGLPAMD